MSTPFETRVIPSPKMAASWHAQVRREGERAWSTVASGYGPIEYTTPDYARAGAAVFIEQVRQ